MRLAISGTNNQNKTQLVADILTRWPSYTTPSTTYKDTIEQIVSDYDNSPPGEREDIKSCDIQWKILNEMLDIMQTYGEDDKVVFNRCPLDNFVYSLYLHEKYPESSGIDNEFIEKCIPIVRESMRSLDIIYTVPITGAAESEYLPEDKEIDNIFLMLFKESQKETSPFFPHDDRPAVIEIFGDREQRLRMIEDYIDESGELIGGNPDWNALIDPNLTIENFR